MDFAYVVLAAWLAYLVGALWFSWRFLSPLDMARLDQAEPRVTIVTPVKGGSRHLAEFVRRLRCLDYGNYRIVAVVESHEDSALPTLTKAGTGPGASIQVEVAGLSCDEGQKVHNLIHVLERLDERTEIVAFIDADTLPAPDWLSRLVYPLRSNPGIAAVTGHRWIVPDGPHLASAIVAAANFSAIALPRFRQVCWGGTLALRRETIDRIDLVARLQGAVVDDVQITRVLHRAGLRIVTPRRLLVVSPTRHTWLSAFSFGRRQYMFARWYLPWTWAGGLVALAFPVIACLLAIVYALQGETVAMAVLGAAYLSGHARAVLRRRIVEALCGAAGAPYFSRYRRTERWLPLLWVPFHAICAWSSAISNRIAWSGTTYEMRGRNSVRVVSRAA